MVALKARSLGGSTFRKHLTLFRKMMLSFPISSQSEKHIASVSSSSLYPITPFITATIRKNVRCIKQSRYVCLSVSCSSMKIVRDPSLDKFVEEQKRIRFVQKLKTLLLSKPKHYIPLKILSKCRYYLGVPKDRSIFSMIHRYPSIFELFTTPTPHTPLNATKPLSQLCVRLTPAAAALAAEELNLLSSMSLVLANKLQKLLMISSHRRLLLSKLVHLAPDLGLPPNFRSRLCNDHPDKFITVDTSYGRALELVSWDPELAKPLPRQELSLGFIVDRPLKFKQLRLRKGLNLKRTHRDFLINFKEQPDVCPYNTSAEDFNKRSIDAEKRACALVREVLGMTVEKRTLVDHLTHFRKEFGLPNKLRGLILRHPELFYVSFKGHRDSVFLIEGFDDTGALLNKEEILTMKDRLMKLVNESKQMRRERREAGMYGIYIAENAACSHDADYSDEADDYLDDGLDDLFEYEDSDVEFDTDDDDEIGEILNGVDEEQFWTSDASPAFSGEVEQQLESW